MKITFPQTLKKTVSVCMLLLAGCSGLEKPTSASNANNTVAVLQVRQKCGDR